jgi:hypothetical protein
VVVLPRTSVAIAVSVCEPDLRAGVHTTAYGAAVLVPRGTPSTKNPTLATPPTSEAAAVIVVALRTVAPELGEVIATVGAALSILT